MSFYILRIIGLDPDPSNHDRISQWVKDVWLALRPYSSGGAELNFLLDQVQDWVHATY